MTTLSLEQLKLFQSFYSTSVGYLVPGETVVIRDQDLFQDLKDESWFSVLMFSLTGRVFSQAQLTLFESIWALSASYPDPRLWNNRVAAIAATAGSSSSLGIAAAVAASQSCVLGIGPLAASFDLLQSAKPFSENNSLPSFLTERLQQQKNQSSSARGHNREVVTIPGYGRPLVNHDERIMPLLDKALSLGLGSSDYVALVFEIEKTLLAMQRNMRMNISVLISALCLEQGLTKQEYLAYMSLCFLSGIVAVYHDVEKKPHHSFFPIATGQIIYQGVTKRKLLEK